MQRKTTGKKLKNKGVLGQVVSVVIFVLIGAAFGVACGGLMLSVVDGFETVPGRVLCLLGLFVAMYGTILLQIILHEAGHLVFGRLSGYGFSSFRIFSFMWIRERDKIRFRRLSLTGTAGQCLMVPPELQDGKMPVFLYNMGGAILNVLSAALFLGLSLLCGGLPILAFLFKMLTVVGFGVALLNGIPMRVGPVDNDGRNALSLSKDAAAMRAFWVQMKTVEQMTKGVRLKDMPEDWFALPAEGDMQSSLTATLGVLLANRLMDQHRFQEADELMERLVSLDAVAGLHRGMMLCDRIFVELIGENRPETVKALRTKEMEKTMKTMKTSPSVLRTEYALALLSEGDAQKAKKIRDRFDKQTETYPYPCEAEAERELMRIVEERA